MKRSLFLGIMGIAAVLLAACGRENNRGAVVVENVTPAIAPENQQENAAPTAVPSVTGEKGGIEPEEPTAAPSATGKIDGIEPEEPTAASSATGEKDSVEPEAAAPLLTDIYRQVVEEEAGDGVVFSLIYLDDDDIPELAVCDRDYGTYTLYTVKDGAAFCMMDSMVTVELVYFERKGIVARFARWDGGGDEGGYGWYYYQVNGDRTLVDGDSPVLHYRYDAVYDEAGSWTGEGVTQYYHLGREVDEAGYQKVMDELGIAEGNKSPVADKALGKKEILDQLGQ